MGGGGDVGAGAGEDVKVRRGLDAAVAAVEATEEGGGDDAGGEVQVAGVGEERGEGLAVVGFVAPGAGGGEGGDEGGVCGGVFLGEALGDEEDFFDVAGGLGGAPRGAPAGAFADGEGVPGFAGAVAVDGAGDEVAEHLGGRDDDDTDVAFGVDAGGEQPVAEEQVVGRVVENDTEGQGLARGAVLHVGTERGGVPDAGVPQGAGEGEGVAVEVEDESGEDRGGRAAEAELGGPEHRGGRVGGVEFAVDNFFADGGPADFAAEFDAQAMAGEEVLLGGDGERSGVGESEKADAQRPRLGRGRDRGGGWRGRHGGAPGLAAGVPARGSGSITAVQTIHCRNELRSSMKPTLDSRQLHAFAALARRGSFTLAAKDLFLTQSAVSHAIKALEDDLGTRLLDRVGRRVLLTQAGEQFLRHTEKILREMEAARAGLETLTKWGHGRLRVGASTTACQHILPTVLREFRQSYPKCVIRIEPGDHGQQLELLRGGHIDLAIVLEPPAPVVSELVFVPLFQDELRFLVAPLHPWATLGRVPREAIESETLVLYNKASQTFRLVAEYFREEKISLSNYIELGSMEAIKELVKIGLGAGVFAPWIARAELQSGSLVSLPLGGRKLRRHWGVAHLKGRRLALAEETFVGLCQSATETLGLSEPRAVA